MPAAHPDNGGIEVYSRTPGNTAEVIEAALTARGYGEFESTTYSMAPATATELDAHGNPIAQPGPDGKIPGETTPPVADPATPPAEPAAQPGTGEPQRAARPGKHERQLAKRDKIIEDLREENRKRDLEMAEIRGMLKGTPRAQEVAPQEIPVAQTVTPAPIEIPKFDKPRPKRENFFDKEDPETAYEDAVADWKYESREFDKTARADVERRQTEQRTQQTAAEKAVERWNNAVAEAKTAYTDYDAVMSKPHFDKDQKPLAIKSNAMDFVARARATGPKILYWLGTHPEEAHDLAVKTLIADPSDAWAVEDAMRQVRAKFDSIEEELKTTPPAAQPKPGETPAEEIDPDEDDEELEVDPNLPIVSSEPAAGKKVEQAPSPGAVDTKPPASAAPVANLPAVPKSEPVSRVGARGAHTNRPISALPKEVVREMTPEQYRLKRQAESSAAARG